MRSRRGSGERRSGKRLVRGGGERGRRVWEGEIPEDLTRAVKGLVLVQRCVVSRRRNTQHQEFVSFTICYLFLCLSMSLRLRVPSLEPIHLRLCGTEGELWM